MSDNNSPETPQQPNDMPKWLEDTYQEQGVDPNQAPKVPIPKYLVATLPEHAPPEQRSTATLIDLHRLMRHWSEHWLSQEDSLKTNDDARSLLYDQVKDYLSLFRVMKDAPYKEELPITPVESNTPFRSQPAKHHGPRVEEASPNFHNKTTADLPSYFHSINIAMDNIENKLPPHQPSEPPTEIDPVPHIVMYEKYHGIYHDLRSPFNILSMSLNLLQTADHDPKQKDYLIEMTVGALHKLEETLDSSALELLNQYPHENLTNNDLINAFRTSAEQQGLVPHVNEDMPTVSIDWSLLWFSRLLTNADTNILKALLQKQKETGNPAPLTVGLDVRQIEIGDDNCTDIILTDGGLGFPGKIVVGGFQHQETFWGGSAEGTGVGMDYQNQVLKEHYNAELIPRVTRDENGNVTGSQLIVRFHSQPSKENSAES